MLLICVDMLSTYDYRLVRYSILPDCLKGAIRTEFSHIAKI